MKQLRQPSWAQRATLCCALAALALAVSLGTRLLAQDDDGDARHVAAGRQLFERETFGGNGRTCLTCHGSSTGTVSPAEARERFALNPSDPLFTGDGSDDGAGHGVERMLADATVLVRLPLPENVSLAADPAARSVVLRRGIPSTLNTPALDPVLMYDGRQPSLEAQAFAAIADHGQAARPPTAKELERDCCVREDAAVLS